MNHYPDPGIEHGHFRVLPQTDGGYVIADQRRPLGNQVVMAKGRPMKWGKATDAGETARQWFEAGR